MGLILRQNIGKSVKLCFAFDWPLLLGTGSSLTHHAFLIEAGIVSQRNEQPCYIILRVFNTFFFHFLGFYKHALFLVEILLTPVV